MLHARLPLVRRLGGGADATCSPPMSRPSRRRTSSITTTSCSTGPRCWRSRRSPPTSAAASTMCWSTSTRTPTGCRPRSCSALKPDGRGLDRGRRRRPVDLFLPRRDGPQHPRLSRARSRPPAAVVTLERNYRSTQPILAASNAVIGLAAERFTKNLWSDRGAGERPALVTVARRGRPGALRRRARAREPRGRHGAEGAGRALPRLAPQRPARGRADPPQHPLREVRRAEVPRRRPRQGRAGAAALRREPARPRRRLPRAAAPARHRPVDRRRTSSTASAEAADRRRRSPASRRRPRAAADWPAFAALVAGLRGRQRRLAGRARAVRAAGTSRISSASTRTPIVAPRRPPPARADRRRLSLARALPDRAHARPARRDQRRGRRRRSSTRTI